MIEQIPQLAPVCHTLQGNAKESKPASVADVLQAYKNSIVQQQAVEEEDELLQGKFETVQRKEAPNITGMPDTLKAGVEQLSGLDMSDVKVYYNSSKPAGVQAYAYTQGTDIHVAPGQEKHLGHEAWHVAQQKQGRVQPTTTVGGMPVNDNAGLEKEADVMGGKALQMKLEESKTGAVANPFTQKKSNEKKGFGFVDNRTKSVEQSMLLQVSDKLTAARVRRPTQMKRAALIDAPSDELENTVKAMEDRAGNEDVVNDDLQGMLWDFKRANIKNECTYYKATNEEKDEAERFGLMALKEPPRVEGPLQTDTMLWVEGLVSETHSGLGAYLLDYAENLIKETEGKDTLGLAAFTSDEHSTLGDYYTDKRRMTKSTDSVYKVNEENDDDQLQEYTYPIYTKAVPPISK